MKLEIGIHSKLFSYYFDYGDDVSQNGGNKMKIYIC